MKYSGDKMNILNCFKVIEDLEKMTKDDWHIAGRLFVDTSFIKTMINESDSSAIELSLRLRDNMDTKVFGITVTDKKIKGFVKQMYGLKFHEVAICDSIGVDICFRPDLVSRIIVDYAKRIEADIITFGSNAPNGNNYLTPFYAAEMLNMKCISNVMKFHPISDGEIMVTYQGDMGIITVNVHTPIVLIIDNAPGTSLRIPTLKDKIEGGKKKVYEINIQEYEETCIKVMKPLKLTNIDNSRNYKVIEKEELIKLIEDSRK